MSNFYTVVLIGLVLTGCGKKEYRPQETSSGALISALNQSDPDSVIQKVETKTNPDNDELYFLASAYSMKAQIDVFSLYPVLQMYLFSKPAKDWNDLSEIRDPYRKFLNRLEGNKYGTNNEEKVKQWKKFDGRLRKRLELDKEIELCEGLNPEKKIKWESDFQSIFDKANDTDEWPDNLYDLFEELQKKVTDQSDSKDTNINYGCFYNMQEHYVHLARYNRIKNNFMNDKKKNERKSQKYKDIDELQELVLEILWKTYESVPLVQRIPTITQDQQEYATKSLNILMGLRDEPAIKEKVFQNVTLISTISLLSIYRQALNLDHADSINSLFCYSNIDVLIENYPLIISRVGIINTIIKENANTMGLVEALPAIREFDEKIPTELTDEAKVHFRENFLQKQTEKCFDQQ